MDPKRIDTFWDLFEAGQFEQAEQVALALTHDFPQLAEPSYLLGSLYQTRGDDRRAETYYTRALQLDSNHLASLNNLGVLLTRLERRDEAIVLLEKKVALNPQDAHGHSNLANALASVGRLEEAFSHYEQALRLNPNFLEALINCASYRLLVNQPELALPLLERAAALQPGSWQAHVSLGQALVRLKRSSEAIPHFQEARRLRPDDPDILTQLGHAHLDVKDYPAAAVVLKECAERFPDYVPVFKQLGVLCFKLNRLAEAATFLQHFLSRQPYNAEGLLNLGFVYTTMGRYTEALPLLLESIRLDPNLVEAHNSLGILHGRQGYDAESVAYFERALEMKPDHWEMHANRAMILLRQARFDEGWPEYENRLKLLPPPPSAAPHWQGEDPRGKTILLTWEQGLGDTIHFIRYAPLVKDRGVRVLAAVQKSLIPLLGSVAGIDEILPHDGPLPPHDFQIAMASLPHRLGSLEAPVPYLTAEPERIERWQKELSAIAGFRIGIAWQGDPSFGGDKHRSVPLRYFAALAEVPGVTLISLQKYVGMEQIAENAQRVPFQEWGSRLDNEGAFLDTAAVMAGLDLVIASDSAALHVAGALGIPVWMPTSFAPDWRWFREGETSLWYPTLRLFRQKTLDDWGEVFDRMATELRLISASRRA